MGQIKAVQRSESFYSKQFSSTYCTQSAVLGEGLESWLQHSLSFEILIRRETQRQRPAQDTVTREGSTKQEGRTKRGEGTQAYLPKLTCCVGNSDVHLWRNAYRMRMNKCVYIAWQPAATDSVTKTQRGNLLIRNAFLFGLKSGVTLYQGTKLGEASFVCPITCQPGHLGQVLHSFAPCHFLIKTFFFQSSSSYTEKLRGRYRDSSYNLPASAHARPPPLLATPPTRVAHLLQSMNLYFLQ